MFRYIGIVLGALLLSVTGMVTIVLPAQASFANLPVHGIFAINADHMQKISRYVSQDQIDAAMLSNPLVDGISLRVFWSDVEPIDGSFVWTTLDNLIAQAAAAGKVVSIRVMPGYSAPSWLYAEGAQPFSFIWDQSGWGPATCSSVNIPVPWDPIFLAKWSALVQAFGAHYNANPAVVAVKADGINSETEETNLPLSVNKPITGAGVSCTSNNDVANWQAIGYNRTLAVNTWMTIAQMYAQAFPNVPMMDSMQPGGFPPIDQNGQLIKGYNGADTIAPQTIVTNAVAAFGAAYILQNDALTNSWQWSYQTNFAGQIETGYQTLAALGANLPAAMANAMNAGADYLELYEGDINNPANSPPLSAPTTSLAEPTLPRLSPSGQTAPTGPPAGAVLHPAMVLR